MPSIPISELNNLTINQLSLDDFFPIVDSGSMTTFKLELQELNRWSASSGSVLSSSFTSWSFSSSFTLAAGHSDSSSFTSWSFSGSYALNASQADSASYSNRTISSSHALRANHADSGSYTTYSLSGSYALRSGQADSASYAHRALSSSYSITSSFALTASYADNTSRTVPVGTICAYAGAAPPAGWLQCNGSSIPNTPENTDLRALVGTNYGASATYRVQVTDQTPSTYHDLNNGTMRITFAGGSGLYSLYWNLTSTTYYLSASSGNTSVIFTGLPGYGTVTYYFTVGDIGYNPDVTVATSANVGYGGAGSDNTYPLGTADYRTPNMDNYFQTNYTLTPLIWMIKQ